MTTRRAPAKQYSQADLDRAIEHAKTAQKTHDINGVQQVRLSAETMAEKIGERLASQMSKPSDTPSWIRIGGPAIGMAVGVLVILGTVGGLVLAPMASRVSALEAKALETSSGLGSVATRVQTVETRVATATTVRDQQLEGLRDRVTSMERSDQAQLDRANAIATTIASILPRLEEILRRQERLENRLTSPIPRQNSDDAPAPARVPTHSI